MRTTEQQEQIDKFVLKQQMIRIETAFKDRMINLGIKYKSQAYYKAQMEFFCGAMVALDEVPPIWLIYIQTKREIIEY